MDYTSFIVKYKPRHLTDFGDNELHENLQMLLEMDEVYILITGNAGCGKTTLAQAILREYYGLEKTQSIPENEVMFVHNLKDNGIHFFRNEMKIFCQTVNSYALVGSNRRRKKTIVVDDMDMVNEQSQHVFRNFMDNYKNNVQFICTATNEHKVIESLQSRLYLISLESPNDLMLSSMFHQVCAKEKIDLEDKESIESLILSRSNHSMRVMLNDMEKLRLFDSRIDLQTADSLCSLIATSHFENYLELILAQDYAGALELLFEIHDFGYSVIDILEYLYHYIKTTHSLSEEQKYDIIPVFCKYITIFHNRHEDSIELVFFTIAMYRVLNDPFGTKDISQP